MNRIKRVVINVCIFSRYINRISLKKQGLYFAPPIRHFSHRQNTNLENYLVIQRKWTYEQWNVFFLTNPLAFAFAQNFVWGVYANNKLICCFSVNAQGSMETLNNETLSLNPADKIGLAHPLEMPYAELQAWQTYLNTAGIKPPFDQMNRLVFKVPHKDKERTILYTYENRELNATTFKSRAEKLGWRRCAVINSGGVSSYRKNFPNAQVEVFIATENLSVTNYDYDTMMKLGALYFVKTGSIVTGSYTYDEPRHEEDPRLIRLTDLPPVVYSEAIADIEQIIKHKEEENSL